MFTDESLARYKAVVFLSTTGDVLNPAQEAAFERFIRRGGGFVGVHSATDTEYDWPFYGALVGAYFAGHPDIQSATDSDRGFRASRGRLAAARVDAPRRVVQLPAESARQRQRARHAGRAHVHRRHDGARPSDYVVAHLRRRAVVLHRRSATRRKAFRRHPSSSISDEPFSGRLVRYDFGECPLKTNRSSSAAPISRSSASWASMPIPIDSIARRHDHRSRRAPTARRPAPSSKPPASTTTTSGRILGIRSFGKANFLVLSDGRSRIQVYIKKDSLSERDFDVFRLLDFGDCHRRRRSSVPHAHQRADDLGVAPRVSGQVPSAAAREVARADRYRNPLSPALPRSDRQSGGARSVSGAQQGARGAAGVPRRPRISRSRDADDAADRRRRDGAAVPHASQRARHRSVPADCAGAVPEAAGRRRPRARVRDQPQFPERRDLDAAQSRVHDARVLSGLQRLSGPDDDDRGADCVRREVGNRQGRGPVRGRDDFAARAVRPRVAAAGGGRCRVEEARAAGCRIRPARSREGERPRGASRRRRRSEVRARQDHDDDFRDAGRGIARAADVRLRLSDRGVAALEAAARAIPTPSSVSSCTSARWRSPTRSAS